MINSFYVLYYPGSSGSFLTSLLLRLHGFPVTSSNISTKGDCHDLGNGIHQNTEHVSQSGWVWADHLSKPKFCIAGHYNDLPRIKKIHPTTRVILIDVEKKDTISMINARFEKTWNPLLRPVEYDKFVKKFAITDWPDKQTVIKHPEVVKQSFMHYDKQWYQEWLDGIDLALVDTKIAFQSLLGFRGQPLHKELKNKLGVTVDKGTQHFIQQYQMANAGYIVS